MALLNAFFTQDVVIASGGTLAAPVVNPPPGYRVAAIILPAAWTAANITFDVAQEEATFVPLYDGDGTEITLTASTSRGVAAASAQLLALLPWRHVKLRSGPVALPVAQGAARTISVVMVPA